MASVEYKKRNFEVVRLNGLLVRAINFKNLLKGC